LPPGVQLFELRGPFFFGAANRLSDVLDNIGTPPKLFVLNMTAVPLIDATGVGALKEFVKSYQRHNTRVVLVGVHASVRATLQQMGVVNEPNLSFAASVQDALQV
jgi:SulP family sulfate permease